MNQINQIIQILSNHADLSPLTVKGIGLALLLFLLLYAKSHLTLFLKLLIVLTLFIALGSVSYDLIQIGIDHSRQAGAHLPSLSGE